MLQEQSHSIQIICLEKKSFALAHQYSYLNLLACEMWTESCLPPSISTVTKIKPSNYGKAGYPLSRESQPPSSIFYFCC